MNTPKTELSTPNFPSLHSKPQRSNSPKLNSSKSKIRYRYTQDNPKRCFRHVVWECTGAKASPHQLPSYSSAQPLLEASPTSECFFFIGSCLLKPVSWSLGMRKPRKINSLKGWMPMRDSMAPKTYTDVMNKISCRFNFNDSVRICFRMGVIKICFDERFA